MATSSKNSNPQKLLEGSSTSTNQQEDGCVHPEEFCPAVLATASLGWADVSTRGFQALVLALSLVKQRSFQGEPASGHLQVHCRMQLT